MLPSEYLGDDDTKKSHTVGSVDVSAGAATGTFIRTEVVEIYNPVGTFQSATYSLHSVNNAAGKDVYEKSCFTPIITGHGELGYTLNSGATKVENISGVETCGVRRKQNGCMDDRDRKYND